MTRAAGVMIPELAELESIIKILNDETNIRKSIRIRNSKIDQAKLLLATVKNNYKANIKNYNIEVWQKALDLFRHIKELSTMPFDVKTATATVLPYDGSADTLDSFVDQANLLDEITEAGHKTAAIKFLKTRLSGKARLGLGDNFATITALVDDVKTRCERKTTTDEVIARMNAIKEKDQEVICDLVDSLSNKLSALYMADNVPADVARKMATKVGIDTLLKKIHNNDTKIILKAGSFSSVQQAIQKVRENATQDVPPQVLSYRTNNRGRGNSQSRQNFQQSRQNFQRSNRGSRSQQFSNRGRGGRSQNYRQNFHNNNYGPRHNYPPSNNVYYAQMGNNQSPQQGGVGGPVQSQNHPAQMQLNGQNMQMMPQPGQVSIAHLLQRQ